jgi:hypothetical protein
MSSNVANTISFDEIVHGRDANVRVSLDGKLYAVDLVMVVTGKTFRQAKEVLRCINSSVFNNEYFVIQSGALLVSFQHAVELIMIIPCKATREDRVKFANIIRKHAGVKVPVEVPVESEDEDEDNVSLDEDDEVEDRKRRRLMDDAKFRSLSLGNISTSMSLLSELNPSWRNDGRFLMNLEDQIRDIISKP